MPNEPKQDRNKLESEEKFGATERLLRSSPYKPPSWFHKWLRDQEAADPKPKPLSRAKRVFDFAGAVLRGACFGLGLSALVGVLIASCNTAIRPHFVNFVYRWFNSFTSAIGTNNLGFGLLVADAIVVFLFTAGAHVREDGWANMLKDKKKIGLHDLTRAFKVTMILFGPVFLWVGVKTLYADHYSLVVANQKMAAEKLTSEQQRDTYKKEADRVPGLLARVQELEIKLQGKPQVITRNVAVPVSVSGQYVDEVTRKKHLEIRNNLGRLIAKANSIKEECLHDPKFVCLDAKQKWWTEALSYVEKDLEPSYAPRLVNFVQVYLRWNDVYMRGSPENTEEVNNAVNFLVNKCNILDQFIKEFADK